MGSDEKYRGGKIGRPSVNKDTQVFTGKCDVRLTADRDRALTRLAEQYGVTRSDVMRKALDYFVQWIEEE